jgi:Putative beta-barrel porin 2
MRKLTIQAGFMVIATFLFCIESRSVLAQEAVSTTTSSSASTTSSSATATGSSGSAVSSSAGATTSSAASTSLSGGPSGTGIFAPSPVQITTSLTAGYDDNVNTAPGGQQASSFTTGHAVLAYDFGDPRLQLSLAASGGGTYYYQHIANQNYDIDLLLGLEIKYKASPRLNLGSSILLSYLTEPSFNYGVGVNTRNGNYFYTTDKFFVSYEWARRFSTRTTYTFGAVNYDNNAIGAFSNRVENTFGSEFLFQLAPTSNLVAEYRFGIVSYETALLDSTTHFVLGGLDHTFNPRLSATLRGGAEFRSFDNDGERIGPYFEGSVNYALGKRTSVSWTNRYGIEEPNILGAQSRTTFRTGLQVKCDLTSRITSSLAAYYDHSDYHGSVSSSFPSASFAEDSIDIALAFRYAITRYFGVQAQYNHTEVTSDMASREYSRNRVSGGLNFTF